MAVAVDIERVGAGDAGNLGEVSEGVSDIAAGGGGVQEQMRGVFAARRKDVGQGVAVAIENRDAAADEMLPPAGIDVAERQRGRAVVKHRVRQRGRGQQQGDQQGFHAGTASAPKASPVVASSARAAAPRAQIRSPQAWISTRGGGRPVSSVRPFISVSTSSAYR